MQNKPTYTHYGHKEFKKENFTPIKNRQFYIKPSGGFWASRTDAEYGWKEWNENSDFAACSEKNKIVFTIKDGAKILELHSVADARKMKEDYHVNDAMFEQFGLSTFCTIDFERMKEDYDAIEYFLSDDRGLYDELYGWDCDSIVILNPDIVEQINLEKSLAESVLEDEMKDVSFVTAKENDIKR